MNILNGLSSFLVPMRNEGDIMFMWYSICSKHRNHDAECNLCKAGSWVEMKITDEDKP